MSKWKPHPRFVGYETSSDGDVLSRRRKNPTIIKGGLDKDGYRKVIICQLNGVVFHKRVSSLVAECWLGERPDGLVLCHKNGIRTDNRPSNLEYKTQKQNIADKYRHGTMLIGSRNILSKLTEKQALEIYLSAESANAISERMGLKSRASIDGIRKNKLWTHVTKDHIQPIRPTYERRWKKRPIP